MRSSRITRFSKSRSTRLSPRHCARCWAGCGPRRSSGAYPEVSVSAPSDHPVIEAMRQASGRVLDQDLLEGSASMYHIPDLGRFLKSILPELARRAAEAKCQLPLELGISKDDERWLIHIQGKHSRVEPDKLSRRHLSLKAPALVRLLMGHTGIDASR